MSAFKNFATVYAALLSCASAFAHEDVDALVARMNPPQSIEDPRNAICAKDDRGALKYSNHDVLERANKLGVESALYKWGRLHFPNARDVNACPRLHGGQLALRWGAAHNISNASLTWDAEEMEAFERLASTSSTNGGRDAPQKPSRASTVTTNKSVDEPSRSGSMEIFGLKIGERFDMGSCDAVGYKGPCIDYMGGIIFAEGRSPAMLVGRISAQVQEGRLAALDFYITNNDENISKFNEKFGKPSIEAKSIKNQYGAAGDLKIYRWRNSSGLIRMDCNSLTQGCQVYVTSQQYIKVLREKESQRQPL